MPTIASFRIDFRESKITRSCKDNLFTLLVTWSILFLTKTTKSRHFCPKSHNAAQQLQINPKHQKTYSIFPVKHVKCSFLPKNLLNSALHLARFFSQKSLEISFAYTKTSLGLKMVKSFWTNTLTACLWHMSNLMVIINYTSLLNKWRGHRFQNW